MKISKKKKFFDAILSPILIEEGKERLNISNAILSLYKKYGWKIEETIFSDIKARTRDKYVMRIEDGRCPDIINALTFIHGHGGPVFEGRVENPVEVILLMKMLGFEKDKSKD